MTPVRLLAEVSRLGTRPFLATLAGVYGVEAFLTFVGAGRTVMRAGNPALVLQADTISGALRISLLHSASLAGVLLVTATAVSLVAADHEAGTWGLLLLADPNRGLLILRKLLVGLLTLAACTLGGACTVRLSALAVRFHFGTRAEAPGPPWSAVGDVALHSLCVQLALLVCAFAVASLIRTALGTMVGFIGPVLVLAPLTRTGAAPYVPHYWIAGWMGFSRTNQLQTYVWNSASSQASAIACLAALLALTAVAALALGRAMRSDRLIQQAAD